MVGRGHAVQHSFRDYLAHEEVSLYWRDHVRSDALHMHSFFIPVDVDPRTAAVPGISPVKGNPTPVEAVNAGHYAGHINTIGVGANYRFD
jgi:hypothetical protein